MAPSWLPDAFKGKEQIAEEKEKAEDDKFRESLGDVGQPTSVRKRLEYVKREEVNNGIALLYQNSGVYIDRFGKYQDMKKQGIYETLLFWAVVVSLTSTLLWMYLPGVPRPPNWFWAGASAFSIIALTVFIMKPRGLFGGNIMALFVDPNYETRLKRSEAAKEARERRINQASAIRSATANRFRGR